MDLMLENAIPQDNYNDKNQRLLTELKLTEDQLNFNTTNTDQAIKRTEELANLLADPVYAYKKADSLGKGRLVSSMTRDIKVYRNRIEFKWRDGFKNYLV